MKQGITRVCSASALGLVIFSSACSSSAEPSPSQSDRPVAAQMPADAPMVSTPPIAALPEPSKMEPIKPSEPSPAAPAAAAGSSAMSNSGAAGQPSAPMQEPAKSPEPPGLPDLVFSMHGAIEAGAEAMFCQYVQMPTDATTAVPSAESHYTPGSHHFLVFRTNLTSIPAGGDQSHVCGEPDNTIAVAGEKNGIGSGESGKGSTGSYYEAQVPNSRRDLPPGVAHVFKPGEILIMTAHYFNATSEPIDSKIEFRLHRMDPAGVKSEAGTFFLLNTSLNIQPHTEATFTRACPITKDINLGLLWSHMHARGWSFKAWTDDPIAMKQLGGMEVYDQPGPDGWEDPVIRTYPSDPPIVLHAGSNLTISCTYHNTTDQTFKFGQSADTAEMCLLHGMYYPRLDGATERCTNGTSTSTMPMPL